MNEIDEIIEALTIIKNYDKEIIVGDKEIVIGRGKIDTISPEDLTRLDKLGFSRCEHYPYRLIKYFM